LKKKNLNVIVMNSLEDKGAGFALDTNKISILDDHNNFTSFELKSKPAVAADIVEYLINYRS
jgi:phosphopantothenoylcysteine decarboxylase/phosphopantothenate--cysteine ligase